MHGHSRQRHRALSFLLVVAMCIALLPIVPAGAIAPATWYVDPLAGDDGNSGLSEAEAFGTIGEALDTANPYDTVVLLPGTYDQEAFPLAVSEPLNIVGRDGAAETIITPAEPSKLFVVIDAATVVFEGISFVGGGADMGSPGGAIECVATELTLDSCVFSYNHAEVGGAVFTGGAYLRIIDSVFDHNGDETTDTPFGAALDVDRECMAGGAVFTVEGVLEIEGSEFSDNGAHYEAPAVYADYVEALVTDSTFERNQVTMWFMGPIAPTSFDGVSAQQLPGEDAGALTFIESLAQVEGCEFDGNLAYNGAGLTVQGGWVTANTSTFSDNITYLGAATFMQSSEADAAAGSAFEAPTYDGPAYEGPSLVKPLGQATPDIDRCLFTGTSGGGSVLGFYGVDGLATNSVFVDNGLNETPVADEVEPDLMSIISANAGDFLPPAPQAGAASVEPSFVGYPVLVANCTIADNSAYTGILGTDNPIDIMNTIVWNGIGAESYTSWGDILSCDLETAPTAIGGTVASGTTPSEMGMWISEDPAFADPEDGNYRLDGWSPCIDTGTDLAAGYADWDFDGVARPIDGDEDEVAMWDMGAFEYDPWSDTRLGGSNRYETSVEVSQRHFPEGSKVAILATGEKFADGLSAAGLAGSDYAPILLTEPDVLPDVVAEEIVRLGVAGVIIVGGPDAVSEDVADEVAALGEIQVDRIGGIDRYETAAMIAEEIIEIADAGDGFDGIFFIARGDLFADALTASPVAYSNKIPILLVAPDELPEATVDVIQSVGADRAIIVGGAAAVRPTVATQVASLVGMSDRIDGIDRYDTSANFSQWAVDNAFADWAAVGIATGEKFPDALSGGAGIGSRMGVVLLTPRATMHDSIADKLGDVGGMVTSLEVFGGEGAVSAEVYDELVALVNLP